MGDTLPMFPLNSVLFPGMSVPLRVFEDRYRAMVHHLLRVDDPTQRVFGSVGIREGYEVGEHGAQWLFRVGCRVKMTEVESFADGTFDAVTISFGLRNIVDPLAGLREMARVTRPGGVVAASVWDHADQRGPLRDFWAAARTIDSDVDDESERAGTREGHLAELFGQAGLSEIESTALTVELSHPTFEDWWEPFERGAGPAWAFVAGLDPERRAALREECRRRLSEGPVVISAVAWAAQGQT